MTCTEAGDENILATNMKCEYLEMYLLRYGYTLDDAVIEFNTTLHTYLGTWRGGGVPHLLPYNIFSDYLFEYVQNVIVEILVVYYTST